MDDDRIDKEIKETVLKAISIAGSQQALAEKAGLSQGAIGKYCRGEARPKGDTAIRLEKAVGGVFTRAQFAPHVFAID